MNEKPPAPSAEFMDAVCNHGSATINCQLCGRYHFGGDRGQFEQGEQDRLRASALSDPEHYVNHGLESPSWGIMDGRQVVWDCPCQEASKWERFIWDHRIVIANYLSAMAFRMMEEAREERNNAKRVKEAVAATAEVVK